MRIVEYTTDMMQVWDEFILKSKNGGLLHTQKFLSYHGDDKWKDKSVLIYDEDNLKAVFAACEVDNMIISHAGSNCGGLVVHQDTKLEECIAYFELLKSYYKNYKEIRFKKHESIFDTLPSDEIEFAALKNGFAPLYNELSTCVKLDSYSISTNRLDKINRAAKKIEVRVDDTNYEEFYEILSSNLSSKHDVVPTHTLKELLKLKELFPENVELICAYAGKQLISGIWTLKVNQKTLHTFYIAQNYEFKNLYSVSLLIEQVLLSAKNDGFEYVNFGVSTENHGEFLNMGLYSFKESFGGQGSQRVTYSKKLK